MKPLRLPCTDKKSIERLIPHRSPMVLLDKILFCNSERIVTGYTIPKDCIFLRNDKFTEAGILENMAQTAAAYMGYRAIKLNENPKIGYIGAIKSAKILRLPQVSASIETEVTVLHNIMDMLMIACKTSLKGKIIATSEMKTVLQS
jgi:3-hydroxyacyl-[acyl-carrier-protein] dehydratase